MSQALRIQTLLDYDTKGGFTDCKVWQWRSQVKKIAARLTTTCECDCRYKKKSVGNPLEVHRRPLECTALSDIDFRPVFPPPSCQISHDMTCTNLFTLHRLLYPDSFSAETQTRKTTWFFGLSANEVVATAVGKFLRCSKTIIVLPIPNEQHTSSCPAEKKN